MSAERTTISYPFPLDNLMCELWLPKDGLTRGEAARLKSYIDTLVVADGMPEVWPGGASAPAPPAADKAPIDRKDDAESRKAERGE